MAWVKLDDALLTHPKWLACSEAAQALFVNLLLWCNQRNTGGVITLGALKRFAGSRWKKLLHELINAGAEFGKAGFVEVFGQSWRIHDYRVYQPTPEAVAETADKRSERARKAAEARWSEHKPTHAASMQLASPEHAPSIPLASTEHAESAPSNAPSMLERCLADAPDPDPGLISSEKLQIKDLSGSARDASAAAPSNAPRQNSDAQVMRRAPTSLQAALAIPIAERAGLCASHPDMADWSAPERWPEVLAVARAYSTAMAQPGLKLGTYSRDSGVRAIVALYGAGFSQRELEQAIGILREDPWWNADGKRRGLANLSLEVVRRALSAPARETRRRPTFESTGKPLPTDCLPPEALAGLVNEVLGGSQSARPEVDSDAQDSTTTEARAVGLQKEIRGAAQKQTSVSRGALLAAARADRAELGVDYEASLGPGLAESAHNQLLASAG